MMRATLSEYMREDRDVSKLHWYNLESARQDDPKCVLRYRQICKLVWCILDCKSKTHSVTCVRPVCRFPHCTTHRSSCSKYDNLLAHTLKDEARAMRRVCGPAEDIETMISQGLAIYKIDPQDSKALKSTIKEMLFT